MFLRLHIVCPLVWARVTLGSSGETDRQANRQKLWFKCELSSTSTHVWTLCPQRVALFCETAEHLVRPGEKKWVFWVKPQLCFWCPFLTLPCTLISAFALCLVLWDVSKLPSSSSCSHCYAFSTVMSWTVFLQTMSQSESSLSQLTSCQTAVVRTRASGSQCLSMEWLEVSGSWCYELSWQLPA